MVVLDLVPIEGNAPVYYAILHSSKGYSGFLIGNAGIINGGYVQLGEVRLVDDKETRSRFFARLLRLIDDPGIIEEEFNSAGIDVTGFAREYFVDDPEGLVYNLIGDYRLMEKGDLYYDFLREVRGSGVAEVEPDPVELLERVTSDVGDYVIDSVESCGDLECLVDFVLSNDISSNEKLREIVLEEFAGLLD